MTKKTYTDWSTPETCLVNLGIKDHDVSFCYWSDQADHHWQTVHSCPQVREGSCTAEQAATFNLARQLQEEITDPSRQTPGSLHSHQRIAFDKVKWQEIAKYLVDDARERTELGSDLFGPVIFSYSRAQAIADGVLIDVSEMAQEAGIKYPTAVTSAVWHDYVEVPEGVEGQDERGRLWDVLTMFCFAARQGRRGTELVYDLLVRNDNTSPQPVSLKAICGPGDTPEPVLTIMMPDED